MGTVSKEAFGKRPRIGFVAQVGWIDLTWGCADRILLHMGKSLAVRFLSFVVVGVVLLGPLPLVAAGMLLCIGDGTDPDCCRKSGNAYQAGVGESKQLLDGSDCSCCITVSAAPSTAGASSHKASLEVVSGPAHLRDVILDAGTRVPRAMNGDAGNERLSSLRTVVLLV